VPHVACLGNSFLTCDLWALRREHWDLMWPLKPQWWHIRGRLMVGNFWVASAVAGISPPITSSFLSLMVVGGSETVGLTKTILEVEGISEEQATNPSPDLPIGLFWIDIIWVSFSSVTLSNCSCVSNSFSSRSCILSISELLSVCKLFSSWMCYLRVSLYFSNST